MSKKNTDEKVKPIILTDTETGEKYTLEFSRETVKFAEMRGFNIDDVTATPMLKVPELFFYAFRMHHKNVSKERTERILFDDLGGLPDGALERLLRLYALPFEALSNNASEEEAKNFRMTVEM